MWTDAWWLLRLHSFFDPLELPLWEKRVDSRLVNVPTTGSKRSNSNQLKAAQQWASGIPLQQVHMHCRPFSHLQVSKRQKGAELNDYLLIHILHTYLTGIRCFFAIWTSTYHFTDFVVFTDSLSWERVKKKCYILTVTIYMLQTCHCDKAWVTT